MSFKLFGQQFSCVIQFSGGYLNKIFTRSLNKILNLIINTTTKVDKIFVVQTATGFKK